jgi:hypothetical protein
VFPASTGTPLPARPSLGPAGIPDQCESNFILQTVPATFP